MLPYGANNVGRVRYVLIILIFMVNCFFVL